MFIPKNYQKILSIYFALIFYSAFSLASETNHEKPDSFVVLPNSAVYKLELARTQEERMLGLMFREKLTDDKGVLFIFPQDGFYPFYMKNTLIPLDILWLDHNYRIVYFHLNVPPCKKEPCKSYYPMSKSRFVLEFNNGTVVKEKLKIGDKLDITIVK